MRATINSKRSDEAPPRWVAPLSALTGVAALWAAWAFYHERLLAPGVEWYAWIRPALLALGGALGLVAAPLLAARRPGGATVLRLAIGTIPLFFLAGLAVVALRFARFIAGTGRDIANGTGRPDLGVLLDRLWSSPLTLANIVVVALVLLIALVSKAGKHEGARRDQPDVR